MKREAGPGLLDSARYVKGVGPRKALLLQQLGIQTVWDLLNHFPFRIEDFSKVMPMDEVRPGDEVTVCGRVLRSSFIGSQRGRALRVSISDGRGLVHLVWYNMPYMAKAVQPGKTVLASSRVEWRRGGLEMAHPVWEIAPESASRGTVQGPIIPVYHTTAGITSSSIHKIVKEALGTHGAFVKASVPPSLLSRRGLPDETQALRDIHDPPTGEAWQRARRTMAFREMLYLQVALLAMREEASRSPGPGAFSDFRLPDAFVEALPFRLTRAQEKAIADIRGDTSSGKAMNRLLQGDVGSGKTVVAMYALMAGVGSGFQGAFLAPTEILAEQHKNTFSKLCRDMVRVGFVTGATSSVERKKTFESLAAGEIDILVGTHAILEPGIRWKRLGVVVTDEQHRFGVRQRLTLSGSAQVVPHVLVMSATPIPRSLALTLYGDLDISVIDGMPPGRIPPKTLVLDRRYRQAAYRKVREEVLAGRQAYVVCPLIREGETGRRAAEVVRKELQEGYLRGLEVGLIHGEVPKKDAENAMTAFLRKKTQVLVSTTVIEVGIDVEDATVMVIEDADLFGLATLHQLRGRVGRGSEQSYCFLLSSGSTSTGKERLRAMEILSDGFSVAEADLEQRGPGQFFGTEQHGLPEIKVEDLNLSLAVVSEAREEAKAVLAGLKERHPDPGLVDLMNSVRARFGDLFSHGRSR